MKPVGLANTRISTDYDAQKSPDHCAQRQKLSPRFC
jgi:hypothetical protein